MKENIEKKINRSQKTLKGIGILEIIGGIAGIGIILWSCLNGFETNSLVFLILLFGIGFYSYSIFAGLKLFKKLEKGTFHSTILNFLQLISISLSGFSYLITSGGNLFLGYNITNSDIELKFGIISSDFNLIINSANQNEFIYVNILAVAIILLLDKSVNIIVEQKELKRNYEKAMLEVEEEIALK